jgi:hypothetical protein
MGDQQQIERIRHGVDAWNTWRMKNRYVKIDLSNADLAGNNLSNTDLTYMDVGAIDLGMTSLFGIDLSYANLNGTNFRDVNLTGANFSGATLIDANLDGARMTSTDFTRANLTNASLVYADFSFSNLTDANLTDTNLFTANFSDAHLSNANFDNATFTWTVLANVDLRTVRGLDKVKNDGPSTIGIDTLVRSNGHIPSTFLKGAGVPDSLIEYATSLIGNAIEYYTCFISYSSKDQEFVQRLHADLQASGVRCWFAPKDMKIGDKIRHRIDESIRLYDKLLLVLSEQSVKSKWVEYEVEAALDKEQPGKPPVLFPICLDKVVMQDTTAWAAHIKRTRHIGNFECWENRREYKKAFDRLLRDLKAGE